MHNNVLTGITCRPWLQFVGRHRQHIGWGTYVLRLLFLTVMACINSLLALAEQVRLKVLAGQNIG